MDNGDVAFHRHEKNAVGWRDQKIPKRHSGEPDATHELIVEIVVWHTSAVYLDNSRQQREERREHVYDALVHDQNVHRLKTKILKR